jgi:hypothetical protein
MPHPTYFAWVPGTGTYVTVNFFLGKPGGVGSAYTPNQGGSWTLVDQIFHGPVEFASSTVGWCGGLSRALGGRTVPPPGLTSAASYKLDRAAHGPRALDDKSLRPAEITADGGEGLVSVGGMWKWAGPTLSMIEANASLPPGRLFHRSYPNPFNPAATIEFKLPEAGHASLRIYTSAGQEVATLVDGSLGEGRHVAHWDAAGKASGVYFYRLEVRGAVRSGRLVLAK